MKQLKTIIIVIIISIGIIPSLSFSQKNLQGLSKINSEDLRTYVTFLASPLMKGRSNGESELEIALNYIVSQASLMGLRPANGTSYIQPYSIMKKFIDPKKSMIKIFHSDMDYRAIISDNYFSVCLYF